MHHPIKPDELRVLVIDGNMDAANALSYLLQVAGCRTAVAFGGSMGLRVAQLFKPSLVFLYLQMPGGDGCEVLGKVCKTSGGPLLPEAA